jgi:hypothetical protein
MFFIFLQSFFKIGRNQLILKDFIPGEVMWRIRSQRNFISDFTNLKINEQERRIER